MDLENKEEQIGGPGHSGRQRTRNNKEMRKGETEQNGGGVNLFRWWRELYWLCI